MFGTNSGISRLLLGSKSGMVCVAMSGGVDSSVAAGLLARKIGPDRVNGVFMNNWSSQFRCQETSWKVVQSVCKHIRISCIRIDLQREYWTEVFEPMLEAYSQGDTPNPDVGCNQFVKFGGLFSQLKSTVQKFDYLATGHYAGVSPEDPSLIKRAEFLPKDQSYYLATVPSDTLQQVLFPLAHLDKPRVRQLALKMGLNDVANKPDSQGLCFVEQQNEVGQRGFRKFLADYLVDDPGPFVLASDPSIVVGQHSGLWTHTIGQRASVPMPQHSPESRGRWFVVGKDKSRKALLIDRGTNSERLFANRVLCSCFTWHKEPSSHATLFAQYRSLQKPWKLLGYKADSSGYTFDFEGHRRAVAPGQYLVIYENDTVIGAGSITASLNKGAKSRNSADVASP